MKDIILKHSLLNAIEHDGKADVQAVLGKVIAEKPEIKKEIGKVKKEIEKTVKDINSWDIEKQKRELKKFGKIEKPEKKEREGLPELPGIVMGKVVTRFAPEPNGYMHLGHLKAALLSFLYAKKYKGKMILRFDDTNPDKEKKEYYNAMREDLKTFGITYDKEVKATDFMEEFYKYGESLLKNGTFYICLCSQNEVGKLREEGLACEHREQNEEENLKLWGKMQKAKEGEMVVRFKTEISNPNPALRDPVMFRIVETSHALLGKKYRIYPLYNFASVIVDKIINTTLILRDKGFENDAVIQEKLFNALGWKVPFILQFGRIKTIGGIPMKKRKIQEMIDKGELKGFDDLRLPNPRNLLKRGFRPEAIRRLIEEIGPSKVDIDISMDMLETYDRQIIDKISDRYFFVAEPVEINLDKSLMKSVKAPLYPGKRQYRTIPVSKKIFVEKTDLTQYRGKEVRLMHFCNVILDRNSKVTGKPVKDIPKIHWVSQKNMKVKLIMPDGKEINGLVEPGIKKVKINDIVQFERIGFTRYDGKNVFYFAHK
jgi:glutamyl-tRNA synthetase